MDWHVTRGSTIESLPKVIWPLALAARNARQILFPPRPHHRHDGITTRHNDDFRLTPAFRRAYDRAVQASGRDYQIPYRVQQALWCARIARKLEGDFVELGTGRGFLMSAVLADYDGWAEDVRSLHLFDTFLSTPPNQEGEQRDDVEPSPFYATSVDDVRANFAEWPRVQIHEGDVFETLPNAAIERIAFLHVDMNHHDPESFGIRRLWPKMSKGAVMLLDDYAHYNCRMQYRAVNELATELGFDVLSTPTGQGLVVK